MKFRNAEKKTQKILRYSCEIFFIRWYFGLSSFSIPESSSHSHLVSGDEYNTPHAGAAVEDAHTPEYLAELNFIVALFFRVYAHQNFKFYIFFNSFECSTSQSQRAQRDKDMKNRPVAIV